MDKGNIDKNGKMEAGWDLSIALVLQPLAMPDALRPLFTLLPFTLLNRQANKAVFGMTTPPQSGNLQWSDPRVAVNKTQTVNTTVQNRFLTSDAKNTNDLSDHPHESSEQKPTIPVLSQMLFVASQNPSRPLGQNHLNETANLFFSEGINRLHPNFSDALHKPASQSKGLESKIDSEHGQEENKMASEPESSSPDVTVETLFRSHAPAWERKRESINVQPPVLVPTLERRNQGSEQLDSSGSGNSEPNHITLKKSVAHTNDMSIVEQLTMPFEERKGVALHQTVEEGSHTKISDSNEHQIDLEYFPADLTAARIKSTKEHLSVSPLSEPEQTVSKGHVAQHNQYRGEELTPLPELVVAKPVAQLQKLEKVTETIDHFIEHKVQEVVEEQLDKYRPQPASIKLENRMRDDSEMMNTVLSSEDMARDLMKRIRTLNEEEYFRSGKLR